jgi:type II secretory pathway pseudopilin PulG
LIIVIVLVVIVVVGAVGAIAAISFYNFARSSTSNLRLPHTANIVNGLITVQPRNYTHYSITVPGGATGIAIGGSFSVSGGTGNNIEVLVLDQSNYNNWQNAYQLSVIYNNWKSDYRLRTYYDSGQVTTGTIAASLSISGVYYLVYSNVPSTVTKNVQTTAYLYYFG